MRVFGDARIYSYRPWWSLSPKFATWNCFVGLRFGGLVTNHWFRFSSLYSCWALRCCLFFNHEALLLSPLASVLFRVWWFSTPLRFVGLMPKKVAKKVTMRCSHRYFLIWWYVFMLIYDNTYIHVLIAYWWMYPCHTIIFPSTSLSLSWLQWLRLQELTFQWPYCHDDWQIWYSPENTQFPPEKGWLGSMKYFLVRWSLFRGDTFIFGWIIIVIRMDDIFSCWFPPRFLMKPTPRDDDT